MNLHLTHTRLYVNAGLRFPACQAGADLLDLDKTAWTTTPIAQYVDCQHCRRIIDGRTPMPRRTPRLE